MIIQIIGPGGLREKPITMQASQILVRQNNGTLIMFALDSAAGNGQIVAHAGEDDFNQKVERHLRLPDKTTCEVLEHSGGTGAHLVRKS